MMERGPVGPRAHDREFGGRILSYAALKCELPPVFQRSSREEEFDGLIGV